MTLNVYPHPEAGHMHVSVAPPTGTTLVSLMRLDRNGRTLWTAAQLGAPVAGFLFDDTCALTGPVEYVATYSDGSREANTRSLPDTDRPRLYRLTWNAAGGLVPAGTVWTEHDAVIDAAYDMQDVSTVSRRGAGGLHSTRNHDRADTGRLVVWCDTHARARNLRDDLLRNPLQWLRAPDQAGMDHALIVTGLALRTESEAWMVDVSYDARPDLVPIPHGDDAAHGARTLGDYTGTLADLAEDHDMLAEMR